MERLELTKDLDADLFLQFYYLKEELVSFCKVNKLSSAGGKPEITERIAHFLKTGEKMPHVVKRESIAQLSVPTLDSVLEKGRKYDEVRRKFFEHHLGSSFHFTVKFQRWLTENAGDKTYREAIQAYPELLSDKKKTEIGKQFEYNTYIRDFFADNKTSALNLGLKEAILCWKFKKSQPGHNKYESSDLEHLDD
jgi:dTDP-glucose pyrophosphorylase